MSPTAPTAAPTPGTRRARAAASSSTPGGQTETSAREGGSSAPTGAGTTPTGGGTGSDGPGRSRATARPVPSAGTFWKVLAVLGVLGTIGFGLAWRAASSEAATEDGLAPAVVEMRTAGREFAVALTNFDASTIDADFDRILDFATGDFSDEADRFYDEEIRTQLREAQATSRSEIRDIYVQSFGGDEGVVFFVADQTVANNLSPQPVTDTLRVELGMVLVDGDWKVRTVEVLDAPAGDQLEASGLDPQAAADGGSEGGSEGEEPAPTTAAGG